MGKFIDETGNQYGRLTVLYLDKENNKPDKRWICKCSCGTIKSISGSQLRVGKVKSCGCLQKKEWLNKTFGEWTVISEKGEKSNTVLCKCSCGEIRSVYKSHLSRGSSTSCGNNVKHQKIIKDNLTGKKFNHLLVLGRDWNAKDKSPRWICQCDCGNIKSILGNHLKRQKIQSCGCITYSIGEYNILKILKANNIPYIKEYHPEDLDRKLRFDFYISTEKPYFIEFDGKQHYSAYTTWSTTLLEFEDLQHRDQIKNTYCLEHNIPLIRIPYTLRDKMTINDLQVETSKFLITKGDD